MQDNQDNIIESENGTSFKHIFFYCIKRWFIIALAGLIGAAAFLVTGLMSRVKEPLYVQTSASFCKIETYVTEYISGAGDNVSIDGLYGRAMARAFYIVNNDEIKADYSQDSSVKELLRKLFSAVDSPKSYSDAVYNNFIFSETANNLTITLKGDFDTDEKIADAKSLLAAYIDFANNALIADNNDAAQIAAGTVRNPVTFSSPLQVFIQIKEIEGGEKAFSITNRILIGLFAGIAAGLVIVLVIYYLDPRVKSPDGLKETLGETIVKIKGDVFSGTNTGAVCAKVNEQSILLLAGDEKSNIVTELAKNTADNYATFGVKTLFVDLEKIDEAAPLTLGGYLDGAEIKTEQKAGQFDYMVCKSISDVTLLLSKKERFNELKKKYSKIVIGYSYKKDGSADLLSKVTENVIFVINQKQSKQKDFVAMGTSFNGKISGNCIYNSL